MGKDLVPDPVVLKTIIPNRTPVTVNILSKSWMKCTCEVLFSLLPGVELEADILLMPLMTTNCIVRLETSTNKFTDIKAHEDLARKYIPSLVPRCCDMGTAKTAGGWDVEYSVYESVENSQNLDDVWPSLDEVQKVRVMTEVVSAITSSITVKEVLPHELAKGRFARLHKAGGGGQRFTSIGHIRFSRLAHHGLDHYNNAKSNFQE
jgi:hypothetical protein